MSTVRLRHVDRFTDRHGRVRYYFRRGKGKRLVLPGRPGTEEFMLAYQAALSGDQLPASPKLRGGGDSEEQALLLLDHARIERTADFISALEGEHPDFARLSIDLDFRHGAGMGVAGGGRHLAGLGLRI